MLTEKPRILHVIARFNVGGTARYLDNLIPGLLEHFETLLAVGHVQGHENEDSRLEKIDFVRIEHLGRKISPIQDFRAYLELRKAVRLFRPQIIHSHTFKAGVLARLMFFRIPKVHTFHGNLLGDPEFSKLAVQVINKIECILAKVTKALITVGEHVLKDLLQVGVGKLPQYISIASEGQRLEFISREEARAKLGIQEETPVVVWMARMVPVKNPSLALEVARRLPEICFILAGGGELLSQIKNQAPPNARVLGWVDPAEVLPAADVFLSTSLNEGVPYSILEALSAGLPVVAIKAGGTSEILDEGVNGILTTTSSLDIVAQISHLFSNSLLRLSLAESALKSSATKSKLNEMVPSHLLLYKKVLLDSQSNFSRH